MPTLGPTAASTADADRAALHTTASGVPNEHVSRLRQWFCSCASTTTTPTAERINWYGKQTTCCIGRNTSSLLHDRLCVLHQLTMLAHSVVDVLHCCNETKPNKFLMPMASKDRGGEEGAPICARCARRNESEGAFGFSRFSGSEDYSSAGVNLANYSADPASRRRARMHSLSR